MLGISSSLWALIILILPIFLGIGFGAYSDYINSKNKKRVAEATTTNKK